LSFLAVAFAYAQVQHETAPEGEPPR
jgi:hypothetical protein